MNDDSNEPTDAGGDGTGLRVDNLSVVELLQSDDSALGGAARRVAEDVARTGESYSAFGNTP